MAGTKVEHEKYTVERCPFIDICDDDVIGAKYKIQPE